MINESDEELPDLLLTAIGRVATASSQLEDTIRTVVIGLADAMPRGAIVFEGQSMDWLISNGLALLDEYVVEEDGWSDGLGWAIPRLREHFNAIGKAKNDRNIVIHGEWLLECYFEEDEPTHCVPRSRDQDPSCRGFHVVRSRYRRWSDCQRWTVQDVEDTALHLRTLARELLRTYRSRSTRSRKTDG